MRRTTLLRALFSVLLLTVAVLQAREVRRIVAEGASATVLIGTLAPALNAIDVQGRPLDLEAQRGKFVLVSFWASWCLPCRAEMPELASFVESWNGELQAGRHELVYVAVNVGENADQVSSVVKDPRYRRILFGFDLDGRTAKDWDVKGLPSTFLVDPTGRVVEAVVGYEETLAMRLRGRMHSHS